MWRESFRGMKILFLIYRSEKNYKCSVVTQTPIWNSSFHGFKKNRSTATAMIELQDFVASSLDQGKIVGTYSLDLSAAFDLLRPDVFYNNLNGLIPESLLNLLMDFMSGRSFMVQVGSKKSSLKKLKVGCVQGSILGPRLFTLYMRSLPVIIGEDIHLIAYADDTYVSVASKSLDEIKTKLETTMTKHDDYLTAIGMKTNVAKTELTYFSRKQLEEPPHLEVKGERIYPSGAIKVLGVKFRWDLQWDDHFDNIKKKSMAVFSKLKFLQQLMDLEGMKKILTTHFFGMIYYSSQIWLNELTTIKQLRLINSLHYKALRISIGDYRKRVSKDDLSKMLNRATPFQWMNYSNAKLAISMCLQGNGPPIVQRIKNTAYENDRNPGVMTVSDTSRLKIGRHSLVNRLQCLRRVKFKWTTGISDHALRIGLKQTFFDQ